MNSTEPPGDDPESKPNTPLVLTPQGNELQVAGQLATYRSRSTKWYRQVRVEACPKCGHPHLHRAPLPLVRSVRKTAPCGQLYVVVLRPTAVAA
ncbi:hypothetical protein ACFXOD_11630 [Streptomyces sp. NPDC059161]|uniref:hypothetical protein n=1 Tax=Streptomyces sp. NPDC059161 TaxID=3346749 RepID=UPI0036B9085C